LEEVEAELPVSKPESAAPAAFGHARNQTDTAQPEISESLEEEDRLPAPRPAAEAPDVPPLQQGGTPPAMAKEERAPTGGGLASLDEVLKELDTLYAGLSQMEQRLGGSEQSYSKVVEQWQPSPPDPKPSDAE
jgi:hypothetical protein